MKKRPLPPGTKLYSKTSTKVFSGERFDIYQWQQKQFDGSIATYEIARRSDTVIVIPVIGDKVVLVKEQQAHWEKPGITITAGMAHDDENLTDAARRELEEETGLIFKDYHLMYVEATTPGVEWFAYTFIATGYLGEKEKKLDAGEKTEVIKVSFKKLLSMTRKKEFVYRPRFIEDFIIRDEVNMLEKVLKNPEKYSISL